MSLNTAHSQRSLLSPGFKFSFQSRNKNLISVQTKKKNATMSPKDKCGQIEKVVSRSRFKRIGISAACFPLMLKPIQSWLVFLIQFGHQNSRRNTSFENFLSKQETRILKTICQNVELEKQK